jgi:hypothetical protein
MAGSIKDWPKLYSDIYKSVKPGGWVEIQEVETWAHNLNEEVQNEWLLKWMSEVNQSTDKFGKKMLIGTEHKPNMIDAGFVDVKEDIRKVSQTSYHSALDNV